MEPCAASQSAAATNGRLLGGKTASLRTRNAGRAVDVTKQTRVPESRSSSELAGARRSRSTTATCTEHHEGGSGRMHFSPAGLPRRRFHQRVHASTYASRAAGRKPDHPPLNALSSALISAGEHGGARRPRPPGSASIGSPLSWGSVSTVSICNSIAPHGRARPRAVTQMALGDLRMTYLPQSASSPRDLLRFSRYLRNINPMASDGVITADVRSALRGCGCITQ